MFKFTVTDGARVLIFSAFSYVVAYVFQLAYLSHFEIGSVAVSITITNLIVSLTALVVLLFILDQLAELWREVEPNLRKNHPFARLIRENLRYLFAISLLVAFMYGLSGEVHYLLYLISSVYFIVPLLVATFYLIFRKSSFTDGLNEYYKKTDQDKADYHKQKSPAYSDGLWTYIAAAFICIAIASLGGKLMAQNTNEFYVIEKSDSYKDLLIEKNEDELVIKRFNTKTKSFENGFSLKPFDGSLMLSERLDISSQ